MRFWHFKRHLNWPTEGRVIFFLFQSLPKVEPKHLSWTFSDWFLGLASRSHGGYRLWRQDKWFVKNHFHIDRVMLTDISFFQVCQDSNEIQSLKKTNETWPLDDIWNKNFFPDGDVAKSQHAGQQIPSNTVYAVSSSIHRSLYEFILRST